MMSFNSTAAALWETNVALKSQLALMNINDGL